MPVLAALGSYISASLGPALSGLGDTLSPIPGWFSAIGDAVSGVVDWLVQLADKINSIKLPDWVEGHSPPPLADWFSYIASAAQDATQAMGDVSLPNVSIPSVAAGGGAGAAQAGTQQQVAGASGVQTVRIVFDAGELQRMITATIEQALTNSGGRSLSRIRTGN